MTAGVGELTGFGKLARWTIRRDRLRLGLWLVAVPGIVLPSIAAYGGMFETEESAQARAALMGTPTGTVFGGPGYGLDNYTAGAMVANELLLYLNITVALAAILLLVHATRSEEESGKLELVGAAPVGRRAPLAAALAVVAAEVTAIGLALGFGAMAYPELDKTDCFAMGLVVAATGLAFTGVAALAAQIASTGRGAAGLASALLGAAFMARAFGDTATVQGRADWMSWLSPLGWGNRTRVFVELRWWPILLLIAFALVTGGAAWLLAARRDQGAGLVPARRGAATASKSLLSLSGLVWRQTQTSLAAWAGGAVILGAAMGPVIGGMGDYLRDNPLMAGMLGVDTSASTDAMIEGFSGVIILYLAMLLAAYAILAIGQFHRDELAGLTALTLSGPVFRKRLLGASALTALAGALLGVGLAAMSYMVAVASDPAVDRMVVLGIAGAGLRAFPGLIATVALAVFLVSVAPRLAALSWVPFGYAFVYVILGGISDLPQWFRYGSPLSAINYATNTAVDWPAIAVLLILSAVLFTVGRQRFATRDLVA
ncbi:MAG: hypothetical protein LBE08_12335 [Bifidobacteriaceae bacterium]|jgi:ABC-2 type transport system permease protein|nr:hypothetical protein [Bifidobacteriaceae bacterium]